VGQRHDQEQGIQAIQLMLVGCFEIKAPTFENGGSILQRLA
jgi:hypothetical protein